MANFQNGNQVCKLYLDLDHTDRHRVIEKSSPLTTPGSALLELNALTFVRRPLRLHWLRMQMNIKSPHCRSNVLTPELIRLYEGVLANSLKRVWLVHLPVVFMIGEREDR